MHKHTNIYTMTVYKHMIVDTKQNTQTFYKLELLLKDKIIFFLFETNYAVINLYHDILSDKIKFF